MSSLEWFSIGFTTAVLIIVISLAAGILRMRASAQRARKIAQDEHAQDYLGIVPYEQAVEQGVVPDPPPSSMAVDAALREASGHVLAGQPVAPPEAEPHQKAISAKLARVEALRAAVSSPVPAEPVVCPECGSRLSIEYGDYGAVHGAECPVCDIEEHDASPVPVDGAEPTDD